jgi:hypothetical protein
MQYIGSKFYIQYSNEFYSATIGGGTISGTLITTFPPGYQGKFNLDSNGTLWMAYYGSGGTDSKMYYITDFLTRGDLSIGNWVVYYDSTNTPQPNGFFAMTLSSPSLNVLYVNNYDSSDSSVNFTIDLPANSVPCLTGEMEILTPSGYARIDRLSAGDTVITPLNKTAIIRKIFRTKIATTDHTNAPFVIPKDRYGTNVPSADIRLSPNHGFFADGTWRIPIHAGLEQEESGREVVYYHVALEDYYNEKLICHNMPVDSWDTHADPFPERQTLYASHGVKDISCS